MLRLKTLKVKGVRGIVDGPDLHIESGGVLLCGDNATGKSSYIDAIEKILTDKCGSLDNSGRNVSWRKQGSHISCVDSEIELTLVDGDKSVTITLNTDTSSLDKQIRSFLEAARQQSFVLRRRTLLDFINAAPSDRYKAIEHFLKLDGYRAFENQLKELLKNVETKLSVTENDKSQNERTLREQLNLQSRSGLSEIICIDAVNVTLRETSIQPLSSLADISARLENIESQLTLFKDMAVLQRIQSFADSIKLLPNMQSLRQVIDKYLAVRREMVVEETQLRGHFYAQVLESGLIWIEQDQLERCPLCNSQISVADVKAYVEASMEKHERLISLRKQQSEAHTSFLNILGQYRIENIRRQWEEIFERELPEQLKTTFDYFEILLRVHRAVLSITEIESDLAKLPVNTYEEGIRILQDEIQLKLAGFPDSQRYEQLYKAKGQLVAIQVHLQQIATATQRIRHLKTCRDQLRITVDVAEKGRKNAVQRLLNAIVDIADGYVQRIHPGEAIGKPDLTIPERGTGSIELTSQFHTEIGDPRGRYSEGHVDSLGLCLFLAIRRIHYKQRPELSLLVLDDIMHSVDANHRRDTANLIFEEFSDHQIIITTHDPLWFEYLKNASRKTKSSFTQHRIAYWTLETGPVWGDHLSNHEWLISEKGLAAKPSDLVAKAGVLLEEMLQNLCNNLNVSVPFRIQGDYTIDPLWNSFLVAAKGNQEFYTIAKECLDEIEELRKLRNWVGAHWNKWAQTLTRNEAIAFTDAVLQLRNYTYCDECTQFIKRIAELDGVWSCEQECRRYNKKQKNTVSSSNTQLLNWQDLLAMGIPQGPQIARFMKMIHTEQSAGNITTHEEALAFVKSQQGTVN